MVFPTLIFSKGSDLYSYLRDVVSFRKKQRVWSEDQVQRYADDQFYAFTRGLNFEFLSSKFKLKLKLVLMFYVMMVFIHYYRYQYRHLIIICVFWRPNIN
jgi:hypothetical protein